MVAPTTLPIDLLVYSYRSAVEELFFSSNFTFTFSRKRNNFHRLTVNFYKVISFDSYMGRQTDRHSGLTALHNAFSWELISKAPRKTRVTYQYHHTFIYPQMEWAISGTWLYSPAAAHHHTSADTHFPSHRGLEAEMAWVAGYTPRSYGCPKTVIHPSTNRPRIELSTTESQVRHANH